MFGRKRYPHDFEQDGKTQDMYSDAIHLSKERRKKVIKEMKDKGIHRWGHHFTCRKCKTTRYITSDSKNIGRREIPNSKDCDVK